MDEAQQTQNEHEQAGEREWIDLVMRARKRLRADDYILWLQEVGAGDDASRVRKGILLLDARRTHIEDRRGAKPI